ncbi:hypothetical protein SynBIOSU31_01172 [Synechococcus sp. BIOS-U3-1]|nr:hypothetical protein SynBIOSU31_01172 [Synechococcus sp. BIOS-U3-1]
MNLINLKQPNIWKLVLATTTEPTDLVSGEIMAMFLAIDTTLSEVFTAFSFS